MPIESRVISSRGNIKVSVKSKPSDVNTGSSSAPSMKDRFLGKSQSTGSSSAPSMKDRFLGKSQSTGSSSSSKSTSSSSSPSSSSKKELSAPMEKSSPQEKQFTDESGKPLSPYENAVINATSSGMSRYKPNTFSQEGEEVFVTNSIKRESSGIDATNIGKVKQELVIAEGAKQLIEKQERDKALQEKINLAIESGDKITLKALQKERGQLLKADILSSDVAYGKFEPLQEGEKLTLKRFGEQGLGLASKGFEFVGKGGELSIQNINERIQTGDALDVLKKYANLESNLAQGVVSGGVTQLGTSKTSAALFAGSAIVGGFVGAAKGIRASTKGISSFVAKYPNIQKALKGGKIVGGVTITGVLATDVALSDNPIRRVGELGGSALAIGTAFKTGKATGNVIGESSKKALQNVAKSVSDLPSPNLITMGKKGAAFRGGRRLSPPSKTQISKQNLGTYRDPRITQQGNKVTYKARSKGLKESFVKQRNIQMEAGQITKVSDKGFRSGISKQSITSRQRVQVTKRTPSQTDFKVTTKIPNAKKIVQPVTYKYNTAGRGGTSGKPFTPLSRTYNKPTTNIPLGNQVLQQQTKKVVSQVPKLSKDIIKNPYFKQLEKTKVASKDPAVSRYAAQNIKDGVYSDVSRASQYTTKSSNLRGGFRQGTKESVFARLQQQKTTLEANRFVSQFKEVQLPKPQVNIKSTPALANAKKEPYLTLTSPEQKVDVKENINIEGMQVGRLDVSQQVFSTPAVDVKQDLALATQKESIQDFDTSLVQDIARASSSRGRGGYKPSVPDYVPPKINPPVKPTPESPVERFLPPKPTFPRRPLESTRDTPPLVPRFNIPKMKAKEGFNYEVVVGRQGNKIRSLITADNLLDASRKAREKVSETGAASFRILKNGRPLTSLERVRVQSFLGENFRLSTKIEDSFVQKREKRISSFGEKRDISFKGGKNGLTRNSSSFSKALKLVKSGLSLREARLRR